MGAVTLLAALPASAAEYYVDFEAGSDAAPGTSTSAAWQHCPGDPGASGTAASTELSAGDVIHFKGGVAYRGSIVVQWEGEDGAPIVYDGNSDGSWGDGRAVMEGAEPLGGWTPCSSAAECADNPNWQNIYQGFVPAGVTPFAANLCEGDDLLAIAQEPDQPDPFFYDEIDNFYAINPSQITTTTITDPAVLDQTAPDYWDGSYVLVWRIPNLVDLRKITAFDPGQHRITFDALDGDPYDDRDNHYSIFNSVHAIDQPGEYAISDVAEPDGTHRAYLWPRSAASLGSDVAVSVRPFGFDLAGHGHVTIRGLHLRRFAGDELTTGVGIGTVTNRVDITGVVVTDNLVTQVRNPGGGYGGIFVDACTDCLVESNRVEEASRSRGIFVPGATQTVVRDNVIHKAGGTSLTCYGCTDTTITHNDISDSTGTHANGITVYLGSSNVRIDGNRVVNANIAFTMQDSSDLTIVNNVFYGGGADYLIADWGSLSGTIGVLHNTILNSANDASVLLGNSADSYVLRNNILDGGGGDAERSHNIYTALSWYQNASYGWTLGEGESVVEDLAELFVDPEALDFHLRADSPAVDQGVEVGVTTDADGFPRPNGSAYDIGAYEYYDEPPGGGGGGTGGGGGSAASAGATDEDSGCGCRLAGRGRGGSGWWLLLLLAGATPLLRAARARRAGRRDRLAGNALHGGPSCRLHRALALLAILVALCCSCSASRPPVVAQPPAGRQAVAKNERHEPTPDDVLASCQRGNAMSCGLIGSQLVLGKGGVRKDGPLGFKLLKRGCQLGSAGSCAAAAAALGTGLGVDKDHVASLKLAERACEVADEPQHHERSTLAEACARAGAAYSAGKPLKKNLLKAATYWTLAPHRLAARQVLAEASAGHGGVECVEQRHQASDGGVVGVDLDEVGGCGTEDQLTP